MIRIYTTGTLQVRGLQYDGTNYGELIPFINNRLDISKDNITGEVTIDNVKLEKSDYLIESNDKLSIVKSNIFNDIYREIKENENINR